MKKMASEEQVNLDLGFLELLKKLWPYFIKQKVAFYSMALSVFMLAIVGRILPYIFGLAIDQGILKKNLPFVLQIAAGYFALEILKSFLLFAHRFLFLKLGNRVLYEVRDRLLWHVQRLPLPYFDKNPSGRIVTRVTNDVSAMGELFTQGVIEVFSSLVILAFIVVAMLLVNVKLTIVSLLVAPLTVWAGFRLSQKVRITLRESKKRLATINAFVAENINGMKVIQLYDRVTKNKEKFETLSDDYRVIQLKSVRLYALLWPVINFSNAVSVVLAIFYGGYLYSHGEIQLGLLVAFIMYTQDFINPLKQILEKYQQFQNSITSAERIFHLLDEPIEDDLEMKVQQPQLRGILEFDHVGFRYGPELPEVLKNFDLTVPTGSAVALVGATGSGKSTTISLLQRLYEPTSGEIRLNGHRLSRLSKWDLRQHIAVVMQDNFLFRGTLRHNISLGDPRISEEKIQAAIQKAQCEDLIARHGGLNGKVEERGANLSMGERQLIAFARILAFDPEILILDEATANIDSQSEKLIQRATAEVTKGRTSIVIAHRLSTIQECDIIVVLDKGEIIEKGSHNELMSLSGGRYRLLYETQSRGQNSEILLN